MSIRMKSISTVLALAVIVGLGQMAFATNANVTIIAGSSAMFNTVGLGAYNGGNCPTGYVKPCQHWTSGSNTLSLVDNRVNPANIDLGTVWVVWDSATTATNGIPNIWIYDKVDSVVGDRCFFAHPACQIVDTKSSTNADWTAVQSTSQIAYWGNDASLPAAVLTYLETPTNMSVNVAATDIRPEDAWWAMNRTNSVLGSSSVSNNSDGTDGLGYNTNNASGITANYVTATTGTCTQLNLAHAQGSPVYSAFQTTGASSDTANVLAFNILGKDPITCSSLATYTVANVGAAPIVFVNGRQNTLASLKNATEQQLQQVFSGLDTDASAFGLTGGSINAYLREPTSGTMNTTEATVFRFPSTYGYGTETAGIGVSGVSQETCTGQPTTAGNAHNPLFLASAGATCANGATGAGAGFRARGIGTSEVINSVFCSSTFTGTGKPCFGNTTNTNATDGITYTFFSFGNVKQIAGSANYGYITLNGIDPIYLSYQGGFDPGQPTGANGQLPLSGTNGVPTLPVCEDAIWGNNGLSFPNVRNGVYRAWSILRLVYGTAQATPIKNLVAASNVYAVTSVPDYIPFAKITSLGGATCPATALGATFTGDPGFLLVRSHYLQRDGAGNPLQKFTTKVANITSEAGGDMGGAILINSTSAVGLVDSVTQIVTGDNANNLSPTPRPQ